MLFSSTKTQSNPPDRREAFVGVGVLFASLGFSRQANGEEARQASSADKYEALRPDQRSTTDPWLPRKEALVCKVKPYKIPVVKGHGVLEYSDQAKQEYRIKLGPLVANDERFAKMLEDSDKALGLQDFCRLRISGRNAGVHWRSVLGQTPATEGNQVLSDDEVVAKCIMDKVPRRLWDKALTTASTDAWVSIRLGTLFFDGYLKNSDFKESNPRKELIEDGVLAPFITQVVGPADFARMPVTYLPWFVHELNVRTREFIMTHPKVGAAIAQYLVDKCTDGAKLLGIK